MVGTYWTSLGGFRRADPSRPHDLPGAASRLHQLQRQDLRAAGQLRQGDLRQYRSQPFLLDGDGRQSVVRRLGARCGHAHGKDVASRRTGWRSTGCSINRWPKPPEEMPWNFATVGHGKELAWWRAFLADLAAAGRVTTIAIEHEDPFVEPHLGIAEAARLLAGSVAAAASRSRCRPIDRPRIAQRVAWLGISG